MQTMKYAVIVESMMHPPGSLPGTIQLRMAWLDLVGTGQGRIEQTLVASPAVKDDIRESFADQFSVLPRHVLLVGI